MAVIIGSTASVTLTGVVALSTGIISANWSSGVNTERLYQLGATPIFKTTRTATRTFGITAYGGARTVSVTGLDSFSASCSDDAPSSSVSISVTACGGSPTLPSGEEYWATSYGYSKDYTSYGQETWSFTSKPVFYNDLGEEFVPTGVSVFMLRGLGEGTVKGNQESTGVTFQSGSTVDSDDGNLTSGFPGVGEATITTNGIASTIAESAGKDDGKKAEANITINHQPVFVPTA